MKKIILCLLLCSITLTLALLGLKVNDDPITSLLAKDPVTSFLFKELHQNSVFQGRIFVDTSSLSALEFDQLNLRIAQAGYVPDQLIDITNFDRAFDAKLLPLIPLEILNQKLSRDSQIKRVQELLAYGSLPGFSHLLDRATADPFDFLPELINQYIPQQHHGANGSRIRVFKGPSSTNYEKVGELYEYFLNSKDRLRFVGGDFFAYENYRAIKSDISFCLWWSIPLNLIIFLFFTQHLRILVFLVLGSAVSYIAGLAFIRIAYSEIFTLVFAFTSTFVGFNNEYLVHLSGLAPHRQRVAAISLGSAIGTTFIGFLVLLFSDSIIVRQMAVISLGGMFGFIAFLLTFRSYLAEVKFRTLTIPSIRISRGKLIALWLMMTTGLLLTGLPKVATQIDDFRYSTGKLEAHYAEFQKGSAGFDVANLFAQEVTPNLLGDFAAIRSRMPVNSFHPLDHFPTVAEQEERLAFLRSHYPAALRDFRISLERNGLILEIPEISKDDFSIVRPFEFLEEFNSVSPLPWTSSVSDRTFVFVPFSSDLAPDFDGLPKAIPMGPRHYYNFLLTDMSQQMGGLFLLGLIAMIAFLVPVQRSIGRVLYVFAPLLASALAFSYWQRQSGASLNIIHFMGFALVIALALDYSAVAVSTGFNPQDLSKILLTGLCTIASFGVLAFATHPVLKDLGLTVTLGAGVALGFTLFVRYVAPNESKRFQ